MKPMPQTHCEQDYEAADLDERRMAEGGSFDESRSAVMLGYLLCVLMAIGALAVVWLLLLVST